MKEYTIFPAGFETCWRHPELGATIDAVVHSAVEEFREHGFVVTADALWHNISAWLDDEKSGYRDEENGYFLFTPCGCNPLRLNATELVEGNDWQKTYTA